MGKKSNVGICPKVTFILMTNQHLLEISIGFSLVLIELWESGVTLSGEGGI